MTWNDYTQHDAPECVGLWDRTHIARKAGRICNICKEPIEPGQKYASSGMRIDGKFEEWIRHYAGEHFPSGCPKLRARDLAEAEEQCRKDERLWNPPASVDTRPEGGDGEATAPALPSGAVRDSADARTSVPNSPETRMK